MAADPLLARIDRLESLDAIRQLAARYCLALDMRALDALVNLSRRRAGQPGRVGREALRAWFDETLRVQFTGTAHVTGNHIIEFDDPDHAHGVVYSRNEHETGPEWVIMTMMYWDHYERLDGGWFFRRRLPLYWYATDLNKPPIGEHKMRWPDRDPMTAGGASSCRPGRSSGTRRRSRGSGGGARGDGRFLTAAGRGARKRQRAGAVKRPRSGGVRGSTIVS